MATTQPEDLIETDPLNAPSNNTDPTENETFCERLKNFGRHITVEPIAFMTLFSSVFAAVATQTLALEKACRVSLNLGDVICDSLRIQNQSNNFSAYERMVQEHYSSHLMWKSALQSVLPCIVLVFIGGWSDKTGRRKVIMLIPVIGGTLQSLSNIVNVIFFYQLPLQVLIFFDVFFINIAGGSSVMFIALFNYICDITTAETRTHRLGLINLCTFAGIPIGLSLSGIILREYGYYAIYGSALTVDVINITYIMFRISDVGRTKEQEMVSFF